MYLSKLKEFQNKHKVLFPVAFFLVGFLIDVFTITRIDSITQIAKECLYLSLIAFLLYLLLREQSGKKPLPSRFNNIWKYNHEALQFLIGGLLSKYTIFFFKSASMTTSFLFIIFLASLLLINEFVKLKRSRLILYFALFSLCTTSFWIHIIPTIMKYIGQTPFLISLFVSFLAFYVFYLIIKKSIHIDHKMRNNILVPFLAIEITFAGLYFAQILPPLPLSLQYIGIFHDLKKADGKYILSYTRPYWKFWQNGDQIFLARPGDQLYAFVRVFSPTGFQDQLKVRWLYQTKRGWDPQDAIPINISGGRADGFRGYTVKNHYVPGKWRVQIETNDGREVGRIGLEIFEDTSAESREENVEIH